MKRLLVASVLCIALTVGKPAIAADKIGVYVAPKFFASQQNSDNFGERDDIPAAGGPMRDADGLKRHKTDTVLGGGLAVGYDFRPTFSLPVRTELEYVVHGQARFSRSGNDISGLPWPMTATRKTSVSTLFANAFYDFETSTKFTPYVGGGIGMAQIRVKDSFWNSYVGAYTGSSSRTVNNFAWNLGAGVSYSFDSNWSADLGLRYNDFGKASGGTAIDTGGFSLKAKDKVSSEEVLLGLRYNF